MSATIFRNENDVVLGCPSNYTYVCHSKSILMDNVVVKSIMYYEKNYLSNSNGLYVMGLRYFSSHSSCNFQAVSSLTPRYKKTRAVCSVINKILM